MGRKLTKEIYKMKDYTITCYFPEEIVENQFGYQLGLGILNTLLKAGHINKKQYEKANISLKIDYTKLFKTH